MFENNKKLSQFVEDKKKRLINEIKRGEVTIEEVASLYEVTPNIVKKWQDRYSACEISKSHEK